MNSLTLRRDAERHSAIMVYQSPRTFHSPYRAALHSDLTLAGAARRIARRDTDPYHRRTMLDLARRAILRASREQQPSAYWQPLP